MDDLLETRVSQQIQAQIDKVQAKLTDVQTGSAAAEAAQPTYPQIKKHLRRPFRSALKHKKKEIKRIPHPRRLRRAKRRLRATYGITWWHPTAFRYRLRNRLLRFQIILYWLLRLLIVLGAIALLWFLIQGILYLVQTYV